MEKRNDYPTLILLLMLSLFQPVDLGATNILPINLGSDTTLCAGQTLVLDAPIIADTLDYLWSTGETTASISVLESATYSITVTSPNCTGSDAIEVLFLTSPIASISANPVCFGEMTIINSNSTHEPTALFNWDFGDGTFANTVSNQMGHLFPGNGLTYEVILEITNSNGCQDSDAITINSLLKPSALFQVDPVCLNEVTTLSNLSANLTANATVILDYGNGMSSTEPAASVHTNIYTGPGEYTLNIVVENDNTCKDTTSLMTEIYPLPFASFSGLNPTYCAGDPVDTLLGSPLGGTFLGNNVSNTPNLDDGFGFFDPATGGTNISVTYEYTDENACTGLATNTVEEVFPKLPLAFLGDDLVLCLGDTNELLCVNFPGGTFSGPFLDIDPSLGEDKAIFVPTAIGDYQINYQLVDNNGCLNAVQKDIIVSGIIGLNLPMDTFFFSGQTLELGMDPPNPDYIYLWSNGAASPTISISNPGIYLLRVTDVNTGCSKSDTTFVEIAFPTSLENISLHASIEAFPNPVFDELRLNIYAPFSTEVNLELVDQEGRVHLIEKCLLLENVVINKTMNLSFLPSGAYYLRIGSQFFPILKH
ncbi:MAG: PKD domain-containing protein [Bacteroidota bacterium]